ncbi:MAG: phosphate ABC transporter permease PstA [Halanaeroarchaeum sp.]
MTAAERDTLVTENGGFLQRTAASVVAVGFLTFLLAWATIMRVLSLEATIGGLSLALVFGGALFAMGAAVLVLGVASRVGALDTTPDRTAGLLTAVAFGAVGFVAGGLLASQTLALGGTRGLFTVADLEWFAVALLVGLVFAAAGLLPREDLGSTLPAGAVTLALGGLVVSGAIDPSWIWQPAHLPVEFPAGIAVPIFGIVGSILSGWAAAKAHGGFGARGRQNGAFMFIGLIAFAMIAVLVLLVSYVASKGFGPATQGFSLVPFEWPFVMNGYTFSDRVPDGVKPAIIGTVYIVVGTMAIAVPLGVGSAVFLTEYAEQGPFTRIVEIATNGLWSTPSIVFGLFGYAFIVPRLGNSLSLLAGILVLSFMLLPLVMITSREAILAVPDEYRDASASLGVDEWETIRSVVLPAAMPGVITGIILGVGRIAGETAPILLVMAGGINREAPSVLAGFELLSHPPFVVNPALLRSATALPYQLYAIITAGVSGNQAFGWGTAFVLLLVVIGFYAIGIASRIYFRRKLHHE